MVAWVRSQPPGQYWIITPPPVGQIRTCMVGDSRSRRNLDVLDLQPTPGSDATFDLSGTPAQSPHTFFRRNVSCDVCDDVAVTTFLTLFFPAEMWDCLRS
ncbi:hypothetical protein PM082_024573 [Marasmius tenuissimus]|nr:hypothetical protein PM082_024573 [Marasmius tenuissimus]